MQTTEKLIFLAYPTGISGNPTGAGKCRLIRLGGGCKTTLVHDVRMTIFMF